MTSIGH